MTASIPRPLPSEPNYLCRRCQFSLTGLSAADGRLICPECGLAGPVDQVAEPNPPSFPAWADWSVRMMWPVGVVALITAALVLIEISTKADVVSWVLSVSVMTTIVMSVVVPASVAHQLTLRHVREHRRRGVSVRLTAIGFGINCAAILLVIILTWVAWQVFFR